MDAFFPRCTQNSDCAEGLWCGPTIARSPSIDPGACVDCTDAVIMHHSLNGLDIPDSFLYALFGQMQPLWHVYLSYLPYRIEVNQDWIRTGISHCGFSPNSTFEPPASCEFIARGLERSGTNTWMLLALGGFMIASTMVGHMEELLEERRLLQKVLQSCSSSLGAWHIYWLEFVWQLVLGFRQMLTPVSVVLTTWEGLLVSRLTSWNILLNAVGVVFILEIDTMIQGFVISPSTARRITKAYTLPMAKSNDDWWSARLQCIPIVLLVPALVLEHSKIHVTGTTCLSVTLLGDLLKPFLMLMVLPVHLYQKESMRLETGTSQSGCTWLVDLVWSGFVVILFSCVISELTGEIACM
eukprot:TRINITY_DN96199_c0_g1_i1.p1 TRINITY_DN96199_c0_g1~~TRINITY_DN96199_c0_g1_i1.p1  ORF type:complete len:412 (-),score=21.64 TRINITY_DN96199_c0_g1_i1:16-1077(-)